MRPRTVLLACMALAAMLFLAPRLGAQQTIAWDLIDSVTNATFGRMLPPIAAAGTSDLVEIMNDSGGPHRMRRSTDCGNTWSALRSGPPTDGNVWKGVAHPTPNTIFLIVDTTSYAGGTTAYRGCRVEISLDGGLTWRSRSLADYTTAGTIDMRDSLHGIIVTRTATTDDNVLFTNDGWRTFTKAPVPTSISIVTQALCLDSTTHILLGVNSSASYTVRTTDAGAHWLRSNSMAAYMNGCFFLDKMEGWCAGARGPSSGGPTNDVVMHTTDGGATWAAQLDALVGKRQAGLLAVAFADRMNGIAVGRVEKILRTRNGGLTWTQEYPPPFIGQFAMRIGDIARVFYRHPDTAVALSFSARIIRSLGEQRLIAPIFTAPKVPGPYALDPITISWTRVLGATRYHLVLIPSTLDGEQNQLPAVLDTVVSDTALTITPPYYAHLYHGAVRALGESGASDWYANEGNGLFYTLAAGSVAPPVIVLPPDGAVGQPTTLTYRWGRIAGAASYDLQLAPDRYFTEPHAVDDSLIADTSRAVSWLAPNTLYYARVRARLGTTITDWSAAFTPHSITTGATGGLAPGTPEAAVVVAPNPVSRIVTITAPSTGARMSTTLHDALGRAVTVPAITEGNTLRLDVSTLPSGSYLLRTVVGTAVQLTRLVVAR